MTIQKQPKLEWGFYAAVPRVVRTQYKDLSHAEKWLYTCLKDLCGNKGTCFRSLRSLEEETGVSLASLSKMIPNLHKSGLIHAEKKRRSESGKEVWHISIVDIWQANHDYCSKSEQTQSEGKEVVQNPNNIVQNINENRDGCSENERGCSNFSDRRITLKNNSLEEKRIEEEEVTVAPAFADRNDTPSSFSLEDMIALLQASGYTISQGEAPEPSLPGRDDSAASEGHTGQPANTMTSQVPQSLGVVGASTFVASQASNDEGENAAPSVAPLTASTGDTPSRASRIASETPTTDDGQTALSRSGENVTVSDEVQTPQPRRSRKKPEDETLKARVERVFAYFDKLKQETTGNPKERYVPTKAAAREIRETLLPCNPTELKLRKVYLKLWNTPPSKDGFHWKDHMTIKAVCGQYESMTLAFDAEENAEAEKKRAKQALESVVKSPTILVQAEDDYVFDLERVRGNRGRRSAS